MPAVQDWLTGSRFRPLAAPLPLSGVAVGRGIRVGMPWPWEQVDEYDDSPSHVALLCLEVPRTDFVTRLQIYLTRQGVDFDSFYPNAEAQAAAVCRGSVINKRRVRIDGTRGLLMTVADSNGMWTWKLFAEYQARLLEGSLSIRAAHAPGYVPHLETMLGTWRWG